MDGCDLTPAEQRVAALLKLGCERKEIARRLILSPKTVKSHERHILAKLGVVNRTQAALKLWGIAIPPQG